MTLSTRRASALFTSSDAASTTSIAESRTRRSDTCTRIPNWNGPEPYADAPHVTAVGFVPSTIAATPAVEDTGAPGAVTASPSTDAPAPYTDPPIPPPTKLPKLVTELLMLTFILTGIWLTCGNEIRSYPFGASRRVPSFAYCNSGSSARILSVRYATRSSEVLALAPPQPVPLNVTAIVNCLISPYCQMSSFESAARRSACDISATGLSADWVMAFGAEPPAGFWTGCCG